jgi:hypothetical protein
MVVGAGLALAPSLLLLDPGMNEPESYKSGMRLQIVIGCFVLAIGFALWCRRPWARLAALVLLRVGAFVAVAWSIYAAFETTRTSGVSLVLVAMLLLVTGFWIAVFGKGIAYLNQPSVVAELEGRAQ